MDALKRYRWPIIGMAMAALVLAFLAFRPDKLFVDDRVDESLDDAFAPAAAAATTTTTTEAPTSGSVAASTTTTATQPEPAAPVALTAGTFSGIDHSAQGTATVYEQDGRYVLRFEDDTDIQNGPDLYVWMLAGTGYDGGTPAGYIDLGKLEGNVGGQNYELPPEFDPEIHRAALVWCLRFSVPFAVAPLG
jgi:Electron transfer DM13